MTIQRIRMVMGLGLAALLAAPPGSPARRGARDARPPWPPVAVGPRTARMQDASTRRFVTLFVAAVAAGVLGLLGPAASAAKPPRDRTPPSAPTVIGPREPQPGPVTFRFRARDARTPAAALRYRCSLDSATLAACRSRTPFDLSPGHHVVRAQAIDRAGNRSRVSAITVHAYVRVVVSAQATISGVGSELGGLTASRDAVWARAGGEVVKIDPVTNTVVARVAAPGLGGLDADEGEVYVASFDDDVVRRIDADAARVTATVEVGLNPEGVDVTADSVWVANHRGGSVTRIDRRSNAVTATISVGPTGPSGPQQIAEYGGSVWVGVPNTWSVVRLDATTNAVVATIPVPPRALPCGGFAFTPDAVWIGSCEERSAVARIDPATNRLVTTVDVGGYNYDPAVVDGAPWFPVYDLLSGNRRLVRIDPEQNDVTAVAELGLGPRLRGAVAAFGSLWVSTADGRFVRLPLSAFTAP